MKGKRGVRWQNASALLNATNPPCSPDFNKLVEHAHGFTKTRFKQRTEPIKGPNRMEEAKALIRKIVQEDIELESLRADAETMPATMKAVAAKSGTWVEHNGKKYRGSGGDWAPKSLR